MKKPAILWFRQDLRLHDNPALNFVAQLNVPVIPVFIWAPDEEDPWAPGAASRWWLHQSLANLAKDLQKLGAKMIFCFGPSETTLKKLVAETGAEHLVWNRRYEPKVIARDTGIKSHFHGQINLASFNALLLKEPWEIEKPAGGPYQVYTPFMKACLKADPPAKPLPAPTQLEGFDGAIDSVQLKDFELEPKIPFDVGFKKAWRPGESAALAAAEDFVAKGLKGYTENRNRPDFVGVSRFSPHLHFGELSPRLVWHEVSRKKVWSEDKQTFLKELIWRDFGYHLLFHFPETPDAPLRKQYQKFPWKNDAQALAAWTRGHTGFPIVDAGMRELWVTGWMHNRVRMIVASFLVKDLLISWQEGAKWFWDTLLDADLASNTFNWQWAGGCGADAAPFFRIFNPILQGKKFDPSGDYVRKWVPELKELPNHLVHSPWEAGEFLLKAANVKLGENYPKPMVDHDEARLAALIALSKLKKLL